MGAWGVGLYQDDVTCDIKEEYLDWLRVGKSNVEATQEMIDCNEDFINDADDGPLFWFALADTQWKYGRLLPEVKELALKYIHEGNDLKKWENTKYYEKRKKVLEDLEIKLNSPHPNERKVSKLILDRAIWNVGDILLYKIQSRDCYEEEITSSKWNGKYILFKIIGYIRVHIGSLPKDEYYHEYCIATILNWVGDDEISEKEIDELDLFYLHSKNGKYNRRVLFSFNRNELKTLDFKLVKSGEVSKNKDEYIMGFSDVSWINIHTLDIFIINSLSDADNLKNT